MGPDWLRPLLHAVMTTSTGRTLGCLQAQPVRAHRQVVLQACHLPHCQWSLGLRSKRSSRLLAWRCGTCQSCTAHVRALQPVSFRTILTFAVQQPHIDVQQVTLPCSHTQHFAAFWCRPSPKASLAERICCTGTACGAAPLAASDTCCAGKAGSAACTAQAQARPRSRNSAPGNDTRGGKGPAARATGAHH